MIHQLEQVFALQKSPLSDEPVGTDLISRSAHGSNQAAV
jgi:hypothetical protein